MLNAKSILAGTWNLAPARGECLEWLKRPSRMVPQRYEDARFVSENFDPATSGKFLVATTRAQRL